MIGLLVAIKAFFEIDAVVGGLSALDAGLNIASLFEILKSGLSKDSIEKQMISALDESLKTSCKILGWNYDSMSAYMWLDAGTVLTTTAMTKESLKQVLEKLTGEKINDEVVEVFVDCFDKSVASREGLFRYLNQKWMRYIVEVNGNVTYNSFRQSTAVKKKHFTNKNLIVPFTREDFDSTQGGTYVPRNDLLKIIADSFNTQRGRKRIVFLSGMGGCGKSELARAFADKHCDEYADIFWLTCSDGIKPDLMTIMSEAKTRNIVTADDVAAFTDKVLIIVDNCNTEDIRFFNELSKGTGDADVIVTTRMSIIGNYSNQIIPVVSSDPIAFAYSVFEKNYCKQLRWGNNKEIKEEEKEYIYTICEEIQYNTMIVSMIAVRLREYSNMTIMECAKKIKDGVGSIRGKIDYSKDQTNYSD